MDGRAKSIRRIVDLQRQMYRFCEWQMVQTRARERQLRTAEEEVLRALNDDACLQGLFVSEMARQLARLDARCQALRDEQVRLRGEALDRARHLKTAETMLKDAERLAEEQRRKVEFEEIMEQDVLRRQGASFP